MDADVPSVDVDTGQQQQQQQQHEAEQQQRAVEALKRMTPEDGPHEASPPLADLQRVPDRPSSSSRTPPSKQQHLGKKQCDSCGREFHTTNHYLEHVCSKNFLHTSGSDACSSFVPTSHFPRQQQGVGAIGDLIASDNSSAASDVENFTGKIVYNRDGSAIILEAGDSELSDDDDDVDSDGETTTTTQASAVASSQLIPNMVNALHIARNPALYSALYGQAYSFLGRLLLVFS